MQTTFGTLKSHIQFAKLPILVLLPVKLAILGKPTIKRVLIFDSINR